MDWFFRFGRSSEDSTVPADSSSSHPSPEAAASVTPAAEQPIFLNSSPSSYQRQDIIPGDGDNGVEFAHLRDARGIDRLLDEWRREDDRYPQAQDTDDEYGLFLPDLTPPPIPNVSVASVRPPPRSQGLIVVRDPETVRCREMKVGASYCLGVVPLDSLLFLTLDNGKLVCLEFPPSLPIHERFPVSGGSHHNHQQHSDFSRSEGSTGHSYVTTTLTAGGGQYSRQLIPEGESEVRVDEYWTMQYRWEAVPRPILPRRDDLESDTHAWCRSFIAIAFPICFLLLAVYCLYKLGLFGSETLDDISLELNTFTQFDLPFTLILGFVLVSKMLWDRLRREWKMCNADCCCGVVSYFRLRWSRMRHSRRQKRVISHRTSAEHGSMEMQSNRRQLPVSGGSFPDSLVSSSDEEAMDLDDGDLELGGVDDHQYLADSRHVLEAIERERSQALIDNIQHVDWYFEILGWSDELSSGLAAEIHRHANHSNHLSQYPLFQAPSSPDYLRNPSQIASSSSDPSRESRDRNPSILKTLNGNWKETEDFSDSAPLRRHPSHHHNHQHSSPAPVFVSSSSSEDSSSIPTTPLKGKGKNTRKPGGEAQEWRSMVDDAMVLAELQNSPTDARKSSCDAGLGDPLWAEETKRPLQTTASRSTDQPSAEQDRILTSSSPETDKASPRASTSGVTALEAASTNQAVIRYPPPPVSVEDYRTVPWGQWGWADYRPIKVRGLNYMQDGRKIFSPAPVYQLVWVDFVRMPDGNMKNFASHPRSYAQNRPWPDPDGDPEDPLLVLTWIMPGNPAHNIGMYFRRRRKTGQTGLKEDGTPTDPLERDELADDKVDRLIQKFMTHPDDSYRDGSLKFIPNVVDGSWIVRKTTGSRPAIVGKKLKQYYWRDHVHDKIRPYFEVAIDVGSSRIGGRIMSVCLGFSKSLSIDLHFVIQGENEEELPEHLLGGLRLHYCDHTNCPEWRAPENETYEAPGNRVASLEQSIQPNGIISNDKRQSPQDDGGDWDGEQKTPDPEIPQVVPAAIRR